MNKFYRDLLEDIVKKSVITESLNNNINDYLSYIVNSGKFEKSDIQYLFKLSNQHNDAVGIAFSKFLELLVFDELSYNTITNNYDDEDDSSSEESNDHDYNGSCGGGSRSSC